MSDPTANNAEASSSRANNGDSPASGASPLPIADLQVRFVPLGQTTAPRIRSFSKTETANHPFAQPSLTIVLKGGAVLKLTPGPFNASLAASNTQDNDDAFARFKCTLCCEFMNDPVGCSSESCSSRFCHKCLVRAGQESSRNSPTRKPKCPTCRREFSCMTRDILLAREMYQYPRVQCCHEGCSQELKLNYIQSHESECQFEKVKCRYASSGCTWAGCRGDVMRHEATDCALAKVKFLVQGFRKYETDHSA